MILLAGASSRGDRRDGRAGACTSPNAQAGARPARRLPGVDEGALLASSPRPVSGIVAEQRRDPAARLGRVDDVIDLAIGSHVQALAALVRRLDGGREGTLALLRVLDRLQLAPRTEPHRALEPHGSEL